jgi:uncharacterized protein (TIGR02453 family)
MAFAGIPEKTVSFLSGLSRNNDKAWFEKHRDEYEAYYVEVGRQLVEALGPRLKKLDSRVQAVPKTGGSMMRIHRDTRFAKDKRPYKDHLDLFFWSGGKKKSWDSSGFFFRLTAKTLIVGAGMHGFPPPVLARYRRAALDDRQGAALAKVVTKVRSAKYAVGGESYKKTPRGVAETHPRATLLKHGALHAGWEGKHPRELHSPKIIDVLIEHYAAVSPLHEWLVAM